MKKLMLLAGFLLMTAWAAGCSHGESLPQAFSGDLPTRPFPNSRFALINGVRIHYRLWRPAGPSRGRIFMIHGFADSTQSFRNNVEFLRSRGYFIAAADLPSFGYSDRRIMKTSESIRARLIWGLANVIEGEEHISPGTRWILIGHSLGTGVAGRMAALRPAKVEKLVFLAGTCSDPGHGRQLANFMGIPIPATQPFIGWAEKAAERNFLSIPAMHRTLAGIYGRPATDAEVRDFMAPLKLKGTGKAIMENCVFHLVVDPPIDPPVIRTKALFILGEKDTVPALRSIVDGVGDQGPTNRRSLIPEKVRRLMIKDSAIIVIKGAVHYPHVTHSREVNEAIAEFLAK